MLIMVKHINPKTRRAAGSRARRRCKFPRCNKDHSGDGSPARIYSATAGIWGGEYCSAACREANARREARRADYHSGEYVYAVQNDEMTTCEHCGGDAYDRQRGRRRRYCSNACKQAAYRARK